MGALIGVELLRKLPPGPCDIRDVKLAGFVLRVRPTGTHTNYANYNRTRWLKLGTTATLEAPEAREEARRVLGRESVRKRWRQAQAWSAVSHSAAAMV